MMSDAEEDDFNSKTAISPFQKQSSGLLHVQDRTSVLKRSFSDPELVETYNKIKSMETDVVSNSRKPGAITLPQDERYKSVGNVLSIRTIANEFSSRELREKALKPKKAGYSFFGMFSSKSKIVPSSNKGSKIFQEAARRWSTIRVATQAVGGMNKVTDDLRLYGTDRRDSDIDWETAILPESDRKPWWILMPDSRFKRIWELFIIVLLLYVALVVPVRVSFDVEVDEAINVFDLIVDTCFILDVFINCISGYVDKFDGKVNVNQRDILKHYARSWLIVDLLASIPFYQIIDNISDAEAQYNRLGRLARLPRLFRLAKLLRLLKLLRMFRLFRYMNGWEHFMNVNASVARLFKVTFGVSMVTHLIACLWFLCASIGEDYLDPNSWVVRHGIQDEPTSTKYLTSMYWAFSTLTTVGFGDISAYTNVERVFSIICMVLGVSWYAFIISTISTIINTFDRRNAMVRQKISQVNEFMRDIKLPKELRRRIRDYYQTLYSASAPGRGANAKEILDGLSTNLRTEVILYMHRLLIPQIPFFKSKTPQFVAACVICLKPVKFNPGEFIVQEGAHADELYFLTRGRVVVVRGGKKYKAIVEGSYFGEIGCILSETRNASVRSVTMCELYILSKRNLLQLMTEYPDVGDEIRSVASARMDMLQEYLNEEEANKTGKQKFREVGEKIKTASMLLKIKQAAAIANKQTLPALSKQHGSVRSLEQKIETIAAENKVFKMEIMKAIETLTEQIVGKGQNKTITTVAS